MNETENGLLRAVARGDARALGEIYRDVKDDLFSTAYHLVGESAGAEDVLQDVFVGFVRDASRLGAARDLRRYLVTACLNRARDRLRRKKLEPVPVETLDDGTSAVDDPSARAEARDEAARIAAALGEIPEEQREVVVLRVYARQKFREISETLSVSVNTVQSRWRYALDALRGKLAKGAER